MLQYNGYNIRVIEKNDNEQLCGVIKGVFHELGLPLVGTAYADKDTLSMYEAYQDSRSIYYIVEKEGLILGGCGINQLNGCLLYTSPSPRDMRRSRMPSSA